MNSNKAPKQWSLTKNESITGYEAWRQNLQASQRQCRPLFSKRFFVAETVIHSLRLIEKTSQPRVDVPLIRRTCTWSSYEYYVNCGHTNEMKMWSSQLGQIANFCPINSRNTFVKNSASVKSIWEAIRTHCGFQYTGAHFLNFASIKLDVDERPEDLFHDWSP